MAVSAQNVLYNLDSVLYKILKNEGINMNIKNKDIKLNITRLVIPKTGLSEKYYRECNIYLEDYSKSCGNNNGVRAMLLPQGTFFEDIGLVNIVNNFISNYPRMQIIEVKNTLLDGTEYREKALSVIMEYGVIKNEGVEERLEYNKYVTPLANHKAYDHLILYNMLTSKYIKELINNAKTMTEKSILFKNNTIQGRVDDPKSYAMIMLALQGSQRGIYYPPRQMILSKGQNNFGKRDYTSVCSTVIPKLGYNMCLPVDKIEFEKLGCQLVQEQINSNNYDSGSTGGSNIISFISLPNIIDNKNKYQKMNDIINRVKEYKSGIIYLRNTLPEDIIEAFYPCVNPFMDRCEKSSSTIFGAVFSDVVKERYYRNPALQILTFGSRSGSKQGVKPLNEYLESIGNISDGIDFYIIPKKEIIEDEIVIKLSNQALVFICDEFSDLGSLNTNLRMKSNYNMIIDKLIMIGSLYDLEGIMMHPYIKNLMLKNNNDVLKEIPLSIGKVINNKLVLYSGILDTIKNIVDTNNKSAQEPLMVRDIIFSDRVQILTQYGVTMIDLGNLVLTQGDLRRIYMSLLLEDISDDINDKGVSTNIICKEHKVVELVNDKGINRKVSKIVKKNYKVSVTEVSKINRMGDIRITVSPLEKQNFIQNIGKKYLTRGIHFICGETQSGKHKTFASVCACIPSKKQVLVLEPNYSITEDMFINRDNINLTIYRGKDIKIIRELVYTRPDIILVYKLTSYIKDVLEAIVECHTYTQCVVFVIDGMFSDYIRDVEGGYLRKLIRYMTLVSDQLRVLTDTQVNNNIVQKEDYLFQFIDRSNLVELSSIESGNVRKYSAEISEQIYKIKQSDTNNLQKQLNKLLSEGKISIEQHDGVLSLLQRDYSDKNIKQV